MISKIYIIFTEPIGFTILRALTVTMVTYIIIF